MNELSAEAKVAIFDELKERIDVVRSRYESRRGNETFNSVFSNGVLAGLQIVESDLDLLVEFAVDQPHALGSDASHLVDDRKPS